MSASTNQETMLEQFADDLRVLHKNPVAEMFDHIEDQEALDWFRNSSENPEALLSECMELADPDLFRRFNAGFRACLGTPTLEQITDFVEACKSLQLAHAAWQVRYHLPKYLEAAERDDGDRGDYEYERMKDRKMEEASQGGEP